MPPPRRQATEPLNRERIVTFALQVLDRDGLDHLTMRRLGRELDVNPMAVYHYLPNKDALFDAIVEALWSNVRLPERQGTWKKQLLDLAHAIRAQLHRHPNALPIIATRPNLSAPGLEALEHGATILRDAGFEPTEAVELLSAGFSFLIGHALAEVGRPPGGDDVPNDSVQVLLTDPAVRDRYPLVAAGIVAAAQSSPESQMNGSFEAGLTAFVQGIESLARDLRE